MDTDVLRVHWMQLRAEIKQRWSKIDEGELDIINGCYETLVQRLQKLYGLSEPEATTQLDTFLVEMTHKYEPERS